MYETNPGETLPLDLCWFCRVEILIEHDRFCRHCGVNLSEKSTLSIGGDESNQGVSRDTGKPLSSYATAPLTAGGWQRPISGSLVSIVTAGVMTNSAALDDSRFAKRMIMILISLPIWLMMILLSPLDAYAATKAIARQI